MKNIGKRIMVIGSPGSGKSTLKREMSQISTFKNHINKLSKK